MVFILIILKDKYSLKNNFFINKINNIEINYLLNIFEH